MFNNVALDVFIGLVLIFLLYSLLATIITELLATKLGIRSRMLRIAIERMLIDGYYEKVEKNKDKKEQGRARRKFLYEPPEFKTSLAGKFYEYPAIKYLSRVENRKDNPARGIFSHTKPSYITPDYFAETMIKFLKDKGAGETDMDKVGFCLKFNTRQIQPKTLKLLRDQFENAKNIREVYKENIKDWFNETMDRCNGWYKRKIQDMLLWLGLILAIVLNIDTIKIAQVLANDKEARRQLVDMAIELSKDSARYKEYIHHNGDSVHATAVLDSGFARVTSDINKASLILGLGWNLSGLKTKSSFTFTGEDTSGQAREEFVKAKLIAYSLNGYYKRRNDLRGSINSETRKITAYKQDLAQAIADTLYYTKRLKIQNTGTIGNSLMQAKESAINMERALSNSVLTIRKDSVALAAAQSEINRLQNNLATLSGQAFTDVDSVSYDRGHEEKGVTVYGREHYGFPGTIWHLFIHLLKGLPGFLITSLAISLGAPFWFDLLRKLVAIRGAGIKPEEKKEEPGNKKVSHPVTQPDVNPAVIMSRQSIIPADIIDEAILNYGPSLKSIPGVKSVFKGFESPTNKKWLQINVSDDSAEREVLKRHRNLQVGGTPVKYKIVVSGSPQTQLFNMGQIFNASKKNGSGSLGCILEDTETNTRHLLSCWHVLKGNADYDKDDDQIRILDNKQFEIAHRWAGGIFGAFDFALAQFTPLAIKQNLDNEKLFKNLEISQCDHRKISGADIIRQIGVKYYDALGQSRKEGKILTDTSSVEIHYRDKIRVIEDVLILTGLSSEITISKPGNSGSVVFDDKGFAIAMIIAGDNKYTYAMKLSNFFNIHQEMKILI